MAFEVGVIYFLQTRIKIASYSVCTYTLRKPKIITRISIRTIA